MWRTRGGAFGEAAGGKPLGLASTIVHETTHLRDGPDELLAYDAQLVTLRGLKAPAALIGNIERAKAVVVDARE